MGFTFGSISSSTVGCGAPYNTQLEGYSHFFLLALLRPRVGLHNREIDMGRSLCLLGTS